MNIAYLEAFDELQEKNTFRGQQWFGERQRLVEKYSWAVPNEDVIRYLAEFEHLYEAGAGNGYWANLIESADGDVTPFDKDVPEETYVEVEEGYVDDYDLRDEAVLMVWPPHHKKMAEKVLHQKPSHVLYVGEQKGGCTATSAFFDSLDSTYGLVAKLDIPSYAGVHDNFFHYVRKT